jgi:hypothetical protein
MDSKRDVRVKDMSQLIVENLLTYGLPASETLVDSRSLKRYYAQRDSYSAGDSMVFNLDTGTDYVHGSTSYLTFSVQSLDDATGASATFGGLNGTALNLFNNATLKNGEVIDREEAINVRSVATLGYEKSAHFHNTQGQLMGASGHDALTQDFKNATEVCIPLGHVMGFFNTDQLIPSQIVAGSRLTIKLEDAFRAFMFATTPAGTAGYVISNPSIMLDSYSLTTSARVFLEKRASGADGLPYTWKAWEHVSVAVPAGITRVSANVGRPVSDALSAVCKIRNDAGDSKTESTTDSFASQGWDNTTSTRFKLGAMTFPDQRVESSAEQYQLALKTFKKMRGDDNMPHNSYRAFVDSQAIVSMGFERHYAMNLAGLRLNTGGRTLTLDWQVETNVANVQIDCFMGYVRVASGFADGSVQVQF